VNAFLCIFYQFVEELVEDVLLVYVVRVGVHHDRRGGSSGTKISMVQMAVVGIETFESVGLGKVVGLIDGGHALCKGSEGGDVGTGTEGFMLDGARKGVVARIWGVIQRVEIRGLMESEDDRGLV
jgi:hypothetical protein